VPDPAEQTYSRKKWQRNQANPQLAQNFIHFGVQSIDLVDLHQSVSIVGLLAEPGNSLYGMSFRSLIR
jgi:hypothetical protein